MYEHFYNLSAEPFRLSPDHRFCYNHALYAKAKAYMAYAFMRAEGFVLITGQPGTGKTTLVGDLIESLADRDVTVANLVSTQLQADDLLRMVAFYFGVKVETGEKADVLQQLSNKFVTIYRQGGRALLIVDEAQALSPKALDELRLLTNLQLDGHPLIQIFLLGQPELRDLLHTPGLEQVHQRIVAASHMEVLKEEETRAYVEHRLRVVGWRNDPAISTAVYPIIYRFSGGVPRRVNLMCSRLLLHACVEQRHQITVEDARTVVAELQDEQLSTRNMLHDELFFAEDVFEESEAPAEPVTAEKAMPMPERKPPSELKLRSGLQATPGPEPKLKSVLNPKPALTPLAEREAQAEATPPPLVTPKAKLTPKPTPDNPQSTPKPGLTSKPELAPRPQATPQPELTARLKLTPKPEVKPGLERQPGRTSPDVEPETETEAELKSTAQPRPRPEVKPAVESVVIEAESAFAASREVFYEEEFEAIEDVAHERAQGPVTPRGVDAISQPAPASPGPVEPAASEEQVVLHAPTGALPETGSAKSRKPSIAWFLVPLGLVIVLGSALIVPQSATLCALSEPVCAALEPISSGVLGFLDSMLAGASQALEPLMSRVSEWLD